jgi:hypothetical protein
VSAPEERSGREDRKIVQDVAHLVEELSYMVPSARARMNQQRSRRKVASENDLERAGLTGTSEHVVRLVEIVEADLVLRVAGVGASLLHERRRPAGSHRLPREAEDS